MYGKHDRGATADSVGICKVRLLLARGAEIDAVRARDFATAFYAAYTNRQFEVLKVLLASERPGMHT